MATIENYEQQYEFAQKATIKAIKSGQNIVLWGAGANGKSHLIQELEGHLYDNDYQPLREPSRHYDNSYPNDILKQCNKSKWITSVNHIECITSALKCCSFVFINMNDFKYPKYTKLRSGRT